jgi:cysteine sulfinate desulfinase/cysteine desulfurase-like protein
MRIENIEKKLDQLEDKRIAVFWSTRIVGAACFSSSRRLSRVLQMAVLTSALFEGEICLSCSASLESPRIFSIQFGKSLL